MLDGNIERKFSCFAALAVTGEGVRGRKGEREKGRKGEGEMG